MNNVIKQITQAEIKELREWIEYSEDDRTIELFRKFHGTYNQLAMFYRDRKAEERRALYFEERLHKANERIRRLEAERKK